MRRFGGLLLVLFILTSIFVLTKPALAATLPTVFISEIKVRNDSTGYDEFIELFNSSSLPVDLSTYSLEYFNATNPAVGVLPNKKPVDTNLLDSGKYFILTKQPAQILNSKQSPFTSLADAGGRLRLVDSSGNIIDEVAWTSTSSIAVSPIILLPNSSTYNTKSLTRQSDTLGVPQFSGVWSIAVTSPTSSTLLVTPQPVPDQSTDNLDDNLPPVQPSKTCEGLVISELLPNPAGIDTGHEFIELFNPTLEPISLKGCALQTTSSTKVYTFTEDVKLQAGEYHAFYSSLTGLTLPNSAGGTVWLLSPNDELQQIDYPTAMDDDSSWALIKGGWEASYISTPNTANISMSLKPCSLGQVRNPLTNRCQTAARLTTEEFTNLSPCKIGQERNPTTNRCRTISQNLNEGLAPCKDSEERNPQTNRCRNIAAATVASSSQKPCPVGQERNPSTNRCRKKTDAAISGKGSVLGAVNDVKSSVVSSPKWWAAGVAASGAIGYGVYEWRTEAARMLIKIKSKIRRPPVVL